MSELSIAEVPMCMDISSLQSCPRCCTQLYTVSGTARPNAFRCRPTDALRPLDACHDYADALDRTEDDEEAVNENVEGEETGLRRP